VLQKDEDVQPVVREAQLEAHPEGCGFTLIILFGVESQPPLRECALFIGQPLRRCWEVGENEDAQDAEEDGNDTVDDEEPANKLDGQEL